MNELVKFTLSLFTIYYLEKITIKGMDLVKFAGKEGLIEIDFKVLK